MEKSFTCSYAGVNCNWFLCPKIMRTLLNKIKEHAKNIHNFEGIPPELYEKVKNAIK